MQHQTEEQLAAYALGALDLEQRQQVELHLEGCASCQAVLADYRSIGEALLYAPGSRTPGKGLRKRLEGQLRETSERPARRQLRLRTLAPVFGLAVGLILLIAVNIGLLLQAQKLIAQGQQALAQQQAGQTALAIASYPSAQVALIEGEGVRGTFVYDPGYPVGVMYVWGLQPPAANQSYQAWLVNDEGERLSGGLLTFTTDPSFGWLTIQAPVPIETFSSLGVTLEPAGGSDAPTGPRILGTDL